MTRVAKLFNPEYRVEIDFSGIDALQAIRTEKLQRITMHLDHGMNPSEAYAYENLKDSPFGENKAESQSEVEETEERIEQALISIFEKAKEDELAKIGNMKESFAELPQKTQKALTRKATEHNDDVNQNKAKTTTKFRLAVVYWRGIGAYKTNPSSVRPSVSSAEQWAMGRVNSYLYALRNGKFRSGKHDTDLLPKDHPMSKDEEKSLELEIKGSVGDVDPTNFPENGDDKQVALRNSKWQRFPWKEALALKEEYPQIWRKGGNILGNTQFNRLYPIAKRSSSVAETRTEEKAIRLREAWGARHFRDHRLAGVVAQIKWLVIGSRGIDHMRQVIREEKERIKKEMTMGSKNAEYRAKYWHKWMEKSYNPSFRQIKRASEIYLEDASVRYSKRAEQLAEKLKGRKAKAIDYKEVLGRSLEIKAVKDIIGRAYRSVYFITGTDQVQDLYRTVGRVQPTDFIFGTRKIQERQIAKMAKFIVETNENEVRRLVKNGIQNGLSNRDIGKAIANATGFSESRAQRIAQTETTKAINTATNQAYREFAEQENVEIQKEWIDSQDSSVRPEHAQLGESDPIPYNADFEVDGYSGQAPGDFGDVGMDVNCRCTIAPVIIED